jgi:FKBP-type peptidyl-prolyl cis-trans isomerase FkpA
MCIAAACGSSSPTSPSSADVSSLTTTDVRIGTGAEATAGKRVTVNYTGWLYTTSGTDNKGTQFDTSVGKSPFTFVLGAGSVIQGWDRGLVGMRVGGIRRLIIPSNLGYGSTGAGGVIPPNAALVFDVELLDVQ